MLTETTGNVESESLEINHWRRAIQNWVTKRQLKAMQATPTVFIIVVEVTC